METYSKSILEYRGIRDAVDLARGEGMREGISTEIIARITGMTVEQINSFISKNN